MQTYHASVLEISASTDSAAATSRIEIGAACSAAVNCPRRPASTTPSAPATTSAPSMLSATRRRSEGALAQRLVRVEIGSTDQTDAAAASRLARRSAASCLSSACLLEIDASCAARRSAELGRCLGGVTDTLTGFLAAITVSLIHPCLRPVGDQRPDGQSGSSNAASKAIGNSLSESHPPCS